jgi:hypothetical protein
MDDEPPAEKETEWLTSNQRMMRERNIVGNTWIENLLVVQVA